MTKIGKTASKRTRSDQEATAEPVPPKRQRKTNPKLLATLVSRNRDSQPAQRPDPEETVTIPHSRGSPEQPRRKGKKSASGNGVNTTSSASSRTAVEQYRDNPSDVEYSEEDPEVESDGDPESDEDNCEEVISKAKESIENPIKRARIVDYLVDQVDELRAMQDEMNAKQNKILEELSVIKRMMKPQCQEQSVPAHHMVNGQNAMLWTVRDGRAFALTLMTAIFDKDKMAGRLCFISSAGRKRTNKELLPQDEVQLIVKLVMERFPETNMSLLREVMNQKCRDSAPRKQQLHNVQEGTHDHGGGSRGDDDELSNEQ